MAFLKAAERRFLEPISRTGYCNPFLPERIECEREALGGDFNEAGADWNLHGESQADHPNVVKLTERAATLSEVLRQRLVDGARPPPRDVRLYEEVVWFHLYYGFRDEFTKTIERASTESASRPRVAFYDRFVRETKRFFDVSVPGLPTPKVMAHLFAIFFQLKRAFRHIFRHLIGVSAPAAQFRAAVWQSIFTHDMQRYRRVLFSRMTDITTLVVGPSGTGKELAARAIGLARHIPFDPKTRTFSEDFVESFHAVSLSALSPTLIESELFGHQRGAYTGALVDRRGWFEECRPLGTVFLDEIGDLDVSIQVKLLRVLQTRTFQRLGDTKPRQFEGKVIAATNRDLAADMRAGRFREDFYYRLCSDVITAPALGERLRDSPEELGHLIRFVARRLVGDESDALAEETEKFIDQQLGRDYPWPGNVRELEQCVRNVLVRGRYQPPKSEPAADHDALARAFAAGDLTADEVLRRYCKVVYAKTGSYEAAARRLGLDRRTVKAKVTETGGS